jgi:uncharacterized membrane protein YqiK
MAQMRNLNDPSGDVLARDEQRSNDINDTIGELTRMGVQLSPTQIEGLRDPMTRERVMNQLIAAGDPTKATQSALDVWESRNEFRPLERQDLGDRIGVFDPRTGEFRDGPRVEVSPNTVANNRTRVATAGMSAATQRRGQDISAATTRRGQNMTDGRAERTERTKLPSGFILNGN